MSRRTRLLALRVTVACLGSVIPPAVNAHGIAGDRYFPGTLTFDDPAVADELIAPNFALSQPIL
jgi:hypothetical protein